MEKWRVEHRQLGANYADDQRLTVGQFLQKWLNDAVKPSRRPKTFAVYEGVIKHLERELGRIRLGILTPLQIQHALGAIGRAVKAGKGNGRTAQLALTTLRTALEQAVKWRMLSVNACIGVERPKASRREMHVWAEAHVEKFLASASAKNDKYFPLWHLALATGMRRGELLGLQWSDIDLKEGTIKVQRQAVEVNGYMQLGEVKTVAGKRRIDLPAETVRLLRKLKLKTAAKGPLVFATRNGKPWTGERVSRRFKIAVKEAKVPELSFHELRHTHATLLLVEGVSPKVVQERLGHSRVGVTLDIYSHVLPSLQAEAAAALNRVLAMNRLQGRAIKKIGPARLRSSKIGSTLAVQPISPRAESLMK